MEMRRLRQSYINLERKFFDGPAVFNYPGREIKGYRSINLMIAQWIRAFSSSYFTMAGRVLLITTAYIVLAGMLTLLMPIYFLSITLTSLFLADIVLGRILRPRLNVLRTTPELASANSHINITYTITNSSRYTAWDVYVDTIPFHAPIRFVRNMACIRVLLPGATVTVTNTITVNRRGRYRLPLPVADSSFPFGLWRWGSRGQGNRPLLIYPSFTPLRILHLPLGHRSQSSGNTSFSSTTGQSIDFHGCRTFRYGDNPRYIHAPSWARLREPIVKEFTDENTRHIAVFIDTITSKPSWWERVTNKRDDEFEAALSLASAIVDYLVKQNFKIDLFTNGNDDINVRRSEEFEHLEHILEIFASIEDVPGGIFNRIPEDIMNEMCELSVATVLLLDWDEKRRHFIRELTENGVAIKTVVISDTVDFTGSLDDRIVNLKATEINMGNVQEL